MNTVPDIPATYTDPDTPPQTDLSVEAVIQTAERATTDTGPDGWTTPRAAVTTLDVTMQGHGRLYDPYFSRLVCLVAELAHNASVYDVGQQDGLPHRVAAYVAGTAATDAAALADKHGFDIRTVYSVDGTDLPAAVTAEQIVEAQVAVLQPLELRWTPVADLYRENHDTPNPLPE